MKKYELVKGSEVLYKGHKLYRIRALKNFSNVKKGDLGGYVESERNLDQGKDCWIYDNSAVYGNAIVCDNAMVYDEAEVYNGKVMDVSRVSGSEGTWGHKGI